MTTMVQGAYDRLVAALEAHDCRPTGRGMARCPAHEDGTASLSFGRRDRGDPGATVHCQAGCPVDAVLDKLQMTAAELFDEPRGAGSRRAAVLAEYRYTNADGELLYVVERRVPKDFRQRRPDGSGGWSWKLNGVPRVLYQLPRVRQAVQSGLQVYVCEGEKDADRVAGLGPVATCNSGGADNGTGSKWLPEHTRTLRGAFVTVIADNDPAGRRHARYVARELDGVAASVDIMRAAVGKDVSDHLDAGQALGDLVPLEPDGDDSEPPADQPQADDVDVGWQPMDLGPYLDGTYRPPVPSLLRRRDGVPLLYRGRVHWISGEPEALKSWSVQLLAQQELHAGGRVVYVDFEDSAGGVTARLLALGVPADQLQQPAFSYISPQGALSHGRRQALTDTVQAATVVVVDACTEALSAQGLSSKDDVDIATWLELLPRWAARLGPAVVVLDHLVKDSDSRGRWPTGSGHKLAGLDGCAFTLEAVHRGGIGMAGRSRLWVEKDRHGEVRGTATVRSTGGRDWAGDLVVDSTGPFLEAYLEEPSAQVGPFRPTLLMARVSDALAGAGRSLSSREVEDRVGGKATTVRQALAALVDEGHVEVELGHHNSRQHRLVTSFPPAEAAS